MNEDTRVQEHFKKLKTVCVPLMGTSRLSSSTTSRTINLLNDLTKLLMEIPPELLSVNLISYAFLPVSSILQRNSSLEIPDQILEKILKILAIVFESWWWTCNIEVWEQVFMLCGAVVGGIEAKGGKAKSRDDETKEAACLCLHALFRPRTSQEATKRKLLPDAANDRLSELQTSSQNSKFVPIVGQTLDALLQSSASQHVPLQRVALDVISYLIDLFLPDPLIPSVLPGVTSTMTRICLGVDHGKGWASGEIVARALLSMQVVIVKAVSDDICVQHGALRHVEDLEDLVHENLPDTSLPKDKTPYGTARTAPWLRGTATQLHIAINTLTPLLSHPSAPALRGLAKFSATVIRTTPLALPQTQPLLLSFLLSLSISDYSSVSLEARQLLSHLLTNPSGAQISHQQALMNNLSSNIAALPRLLSTRTDAKIAHAAGLIQAVCRLGSEALHPNLNVVSKGVGKLLGPSGGIEKWGWSLLSVLEIVEPSILVAHTSSAQLALEADPQGQQVVTFPELIFKNISSRDTRQALTNMFHALGAASGDAGLFAVEWFFHTGLSAVTSGSVAALWCACRLLEGIASISLFDTPIGSSPQKSSSKRLEKQSKVFTRGIAEIWEQPDPVPNLQAEGPRSEDEDENFLVQHQKGLVSLHETLKIIHATRPTERRLSSQPVVHRALCLQLIAISAGISKERFTPLFIHTLYPVLHSLVSPMSFLSATALATLNFITTAASYASPTNLLLSNFDYVLDSVARRLTQRWLDIDATKVLCIMVRLVGADIVEKAGDVVEECFDRLDEFHGYSAVVDGLVEVLNEVLKVIEQEDHVHSPKKESDRPENTIPRKAKLDNFFASLPTRFDDPSQDEDKVDYGPAPREPWGKTKVEDEEPSEDDQIKAMPASDEPPPTVIQSLTKQIISRSVYFLTHGSPVIRARILNLLTLAVPVLPESSLLPSIHSAWPFILNRFEDSESFVVSASASLIEALAEHVGDFMFRRIWDDVWPRFRSMLNQLEKGDATNALIRRQGERIGTESAYSHSHRLYRSLIKTMTVALKGVHQHEPSSWEVLLAFRRFLSSHAHNELQQSARKLFIQAGKQNSDSVWLLLTSTMSKVEPIMGFMHQPKWNIDENATIVIQSLK